jgi:catecholate siderophore receptor
MNNRNRALLPLGALMLGLGAPAQAEEPVQKIETIEVIGRNDIPNRYQAGAAAVSKTSALPKDVPQSLTVITQALITDQGKDSMKGALQNVPGITFEAGEGGRIGDNIRLRGFTVAGDIYLDGMRDIAQYNRDTFNTERIEVLRGSASMLFGRGSTGGVVNQVSKAASAVTRNEASITLGSDRYLRVSGDFNIKTGDDAGLRAAVMSTDGAGRAGEVSTLRRGAALDYRVGIGTRDEFAVSAYHLHYDDTPDYGFRWFEGRPAPAPTHRAWYGVASDFQQDQADLLTATYIHRFVNGDSVKTVVRDGRFTRDLWATTAGLAAGITSANLSATSSVTRGNQARAGEEHHSFAQSDFIAQRTAWGMKHELLIGAEYAREQSTRYGYSNIPTKPLTVFGAPDHTAVDDTRLRVFAGEFRATTIGLTVQDTIHLTAVWKLVAGLRWDRFEGNYARPVGGRLSRSDALWSKRAAIMAQPDASSNYYVSAGTSFNTSGDLYQYDPTTANTPAESARNIELGAKWDALGGDLSLRTSVSRSEKRNERSTDTETVPGGTGYLLSGRRHTDAFELEVAGRITSGWELFAGFVLSHAEIDRAGSSPASQATVGLNPGLTPTRQANLWSSYQLTPQWRVGGGFTAVSQNKPAAAEATLNRAPGYVKFDGLLEYQFSATQSLKLNLENIGDIVYYSSLYRGHAVPGVARNARLTWVVKF